MWNKIFAILSLIIALIACHVELSQSFELKIKSTVLSSNGTLVDDETSANVANILVNDMLIKIPFKLVHTDSDDVAVFHLKIGDNLLEKLKIFSLEHNLSKETRIFMLNKLLTILQENFNLLLNISTNEFGIDNYENQTFRSLHKVDEFIPLCSIKDPDLVNDCINLKYYLYKLCWKSFEKQINQKLLYTSAQRILNNESILFVLDIPLYRPIGMGNVMKGLITFLSFHTNTKLYIKANQNYSTILHQSHFITDVEIESMKKVSSINDSDMITSPMYQTMFTWDWLILKNEESLFTNIKRVHVFESPFLAVFNPYLSVLFNNEISINDVYDCTMIPFPIVKRLLNAKRKIQFQNHILEMSYNISDQLISPSLGVTIRSWNASHEMNANVNFERKFNLSAYEDMISTIITKHGIRSILMAYDNPSLVSQLKPFIDTLKIPVLTWKDDYSSNIDSNDDKKIMKTDNTLTNENNNIRRISTDETQLVKAAVEMLSLSRTQYLLGDGRSTFLQAVYWFGDCKQIVYHPYPMTHLMI